MTFNPVRSGGVTEKQMGGRNSKKQRQSVGSQTDKPGQRSILFAFQTPALMLGGEKKGLRRALHLHTYGSALLVCVGPAAQGKNMQPHALMPHSHAESNFTSSEILYQLW